MGVVYFLIALVTSAVLGLPLAALTPSPPASSMAIPFFGPFVAWAPPVIVALVLSPAAWSRRSSSWASAGSSS